MDTATLLQGYMPPDDDDDTVNTVGKREGGRKPSERWKSSAGSRGKAPVGL